MSSPRKLDNYVLIEKKKKFKETVSHICKSRGLPTPTINFDGCPKEDENQLAHYHTDTNTICVSRYQLQKMNLDDVQSVAVHEVSHLLVHNHGSDFKKEEEINSLFNFSPGPGVTIIHPQYGKESTKSGRNKSYRKSTHFFVTHILNFYINNYRELLYSEPETLIPIYFEGTIRYIQYKSAKVVLEVFNIYRTEFFNTMGEEIQKQLLADQLKKLVDIIITLLSHKWDLQPKAEKITAGLLSEIESIYGIELSLVIMPYFLKNAKEKKNEEKEIKKTIISLYPKPRLGSVIYEPPPEPTLSDLGEENPKPSPTLVDNESVSIPIKPVLMILVIIILITLGIVLFRGWINQQDIILQILKLNCSDGTLNSRCSMNKPYYCLNHTLIKDPGRCGCQEGYKPHNDECIKDILCKDGTPNGECSVDKPFKCFDGYLLSRATECGCPPNTIQYDERCTITH